MKLTKGPADWLEAAAAVYMNSFIDGKQTDSDLRI